MKSIIKNAAAVVAVTVTLIACDTDINSLGTDFLGVDVDNLIQNDEFQVVTFSSALNPVQTNRFTSQPFGIYDDPVYGKYTYDFVSQVTIPIANPNFGTNVVLDSVSLSIPLFSTVATIVGDDRTYVLDSLYNSPGNGEVKLKMYENNYFLNNFDAQDLTQPARFFSDLGTEISANKGSLIYQDIDNFVPSKNEVRLLSVDSNGSPILNEDNQPIVLSREPPSYRKTIARMGGTNPVLSSNINYWTDKIINQQGTNNFQNIAAFQNYFRGLYFEVEHTGVGGNMAHFNPTNAAVILYYRSMIPDVADSNNNGSTTDLIEVSSSYRISLTGNRVNLITSQLNPAVEASIQSGGNEITGDPSLYLKGGPGAIVLVDLFGPDANLDGEADELTMLKSRGLIINDATLTFQVDQTQVTGGRTEPERIIIYDIDNNVALADFDISNNNAAAAINSNTFHLGRLEREVPGDLDSKGISYKLRLTRHVTQVIAGLKPNVRLGIAVTQNVDLVGGLSSVKNNNNGNAVTIDQILLGSAISHEGTVLHGSNSPDTAKRPVFKIFYTEPN